MNRFTAVLIFPKRRGLRSAMMGPPALTGGPFGHFNLKADKVDTMRIRSEVDVVVRLKVGWGDLPQY